MMKKNNGNPVALPCAGLRKKIKHICFSLVALLLVGCICGIPSTQIAAQALEEPEYVREVKTFQASTVQEARRKAEKEGYRWVKGNLNEGTDYDAVVLGYKTTNDKSLAVTDISMAQMKSGYKTVSYGEIAEKQVEKLAGVAEEMLDAIAEFAQNYGAGSPAAAEAYRILNYFQTDAEGSPLLGDYFLSGKCTREYILKILSRANTSVVNSVYNALVAGTADWGQSTWAQRVSACEVRETADAENCGKEEDALYKEYALELYGALQNFAEKYEDAAGRAAVSKTESLVEPEKGNDCDFPAETKEDIQAGNPMEERDGDAFYIAAYEMLNTYPYNEDTLLGDYLVNAGKLTFATTEDLRKIYPLVCALTNGQAGIMRMVGIAPFVFYLNNSQELLNTSEAYFEEIDSKVQACASKTAFSIWVGTDQTVYEKKVALTDELERYSQAGANYVDLTKEDRVDTVLSEAMNLINFVSLVVSIAYCVTYLGAGVVGYMSSFAVWAGTATTWTVCASAVGSGVLGSILGVLGCMAVIASYVVLIAMVLVLVAMFVKWIIDLFEDEDEEYTDIPVAIYDLFGSSCVKYELVPSSASPADLNVGNGKRWNALYFTTDTAVGLPICADSLGNAFSCSVGTDKTPAGYGAVKNFGETVAANLNANVRNSSAAGVYLYYHTDAKNTPINEGEESQSQAERQYLLKLILRTEKTEGAARAYLIKRDYKVLDVNLSPVSGVYTYLGYMTTTDAASALTDIRISPHNTASPYLFGEASYTYCGRTPTGDGLYYTSYQSAGTPILADLQVWDSYAAAEAGYEPVNLFCGGNAYNFNNGDNVEYDGATAYEHFNAKKRLLYFHPSVTFTEGEDYLAGLVLVAGVKAGDNRKNLEEYIKSLGLTKLDMNLSKGLSVKSEASYSNGIMLRSFDTLETYLCYSLTKNPYRAVTDVKSYTASPTNSEVFANFGSLTNGGYGVCDVLYQLPQIAHAQRDEDEFYRGIYTNHSYTDTSGAEAVMAYGVGEMGAEDFETVSWQNSGLRAKGLYVCGARSGKTPLRAQDLILTREAKAEEGFVSVQDARMPNATASHNIAFFRNGSNDCEKAYLFMRKTVKEKKYIASVQVVSYDLKKMTEEETYNKLEDEQKEAIDKTADDICIRSLLASCGDEILNTNVAVKASDTYKGDYENYTANCSYIGVTRTDDSSKAITGLIKYKGSTAPEKITVGGVSYTKCGDKVRDAKGNYWIYRAVSSGAVPGEYITKIDLSQSPIAAGAATALHAAKEDTAEGTASLVGAVGDAYYIHTYFEDNNTYVSALYLGHGKTKNEALCNLLTQGCCIALDMNLNEQAGGEYIYLGYSKYAPKKTDKNAKYALRDVIFTVNQPYREEIEVNGIPYIAATSDQEKGLSLNSGTNGDTVYLYYTTYYLSGSQKSVLSMSPVLQFAASVRDRVPDNAGKFIWENVCTADGTRCDLNSGVIATRDDGLQMTDCRAYLYANRMDNSVVPARKITGGHCAELVEYGSVQIAM